MKLNGKWLARIGTIASGVLLGVIGALCIQTKEETNDEHVELEEETDDSAVSTEEEVTDAE